jgi:hypothetical protein
VTAKKQGPVTKLAENSRNNNNNNNNKLYMDLHRNSVLILSLMKIFERSQENP